MADNYYITINGEKICVSEEVYNAYRQMRRHERTLAEKDSRNYVLKYEDFADGEITGEEQIYDFLQPSVEELALTNLIYRKLHRAIEMLPQAEKELISDLYFNGYSMRTIAEKRGVSHMTIQRQVQKNPYKIKKFYKKLKKPVTSPLRTRLRSEGINYHPSVYLDKHRGNRSYPATE